MNETVKKIELKLRERAYQIALSPEVISHSYDEWGDYVVKDVERAWIFGLRKRLPYNELWSYMKPVDWWEAIKERWAPKWFLKRYPVRNDKVSLAEVLALEIPKTVGDRYYIVTKNGQENGATRLYEEEGIGYCGFCKMPVPVMDKDGVYHQRERK